jgi:hypothetical protein
LQRRFSHEDTMSTMVSASNVARRISIGDERASGALTQIDDSTNSADDRQNRHRVHRGIV